MKLLPVALAAVGLAAPVGAATQASPPDREYRVFVGSEATDRIALVVFGPEGARVEREFTVGLLPTDADGPHGLAMSPDGRFLYITTGHGRPWGNLWKIDPATGRPLGRVELGFFPASLDLSPDGAFAYVANFNLHGDMVPSSASVVATGPMVEVSRLETCTMPHGSRMSPDGSRQYSTCMMDDYLVEVDAWGLRVARHFKLAPGREHGMEGAPGAHHSGHEGHGAPPAGAGAGGHGAEHADPECSPTWATPSADGRSVFVACNRTSELVEVDVEGWSLKRRLPAGEGIYNLAVTRDGTLLVATNKRGQSVSLFDLASGEEVARIPTARPVVHGVLVTPDDRYAFVSVEGVGSEPGTVEIIDLAAREAVARVDVGQMAAGIAFWR
jgi:DNA-binding beta-propeller fold protein YncE